MGCNRRGARGEFGFGDLDGAGGNCRSESARPIRNRGVSLRCSQETKHVSVLFPLEMMIRTEQEFQITQINVVLNWFGELKRLVPTE
ncbi:hypothetical protein MYX65_04695 [Acidobacteria bacterium AH-259-L09]|nr:hypothetical protein [Acidobacteria bacterium AH-259-L09]